MVRQMVSIDWLGLTASVTMTKVMETVIVVDPYGVAMVMDTLEEETVHISLPEFILEYGGPILGPLMLERVLEVREDRLDMQARLDHARQQFFDAMEEYVERQNV